MFVTNDVQEEQRIVAHGGIVKALKAAEDTEVMPARVFAADMYAVGEYSPGIAMSRSLGDALATELGVIAAPECTEHPLRASDRFVVIATDGLWEVYTPQGTTAREALLVGVPHRKESFAESRRCRNLSPKPCVRWRSLLRRRHSICCRPQDSSRGFCTPQPPWQPTRTR